MQNCLQLHMKQDMACVELCQKKLKKSEIAMFKQMIDQEYRVHWLLDNLPVAVRNEDLGYVSRGYPVGFVAATPKSKTPLHYLFNHVRIIVRYSEEEAEFSGARIVGFEVVPFSIKVRFDCDRSIVHLLLRLNVNLLMRVVYLYRQASFVAHSFV
jgi:transmembrane 9 superfamily member 2/4